MDAHGIAVVVGYVLAVGLMALAQAPGEAEDRFITGYAAAVMME